MKLGEFIWADLSTYNTSKTIEFYNTVFGWEISNVDNYYLASLGDSNVAGIFETPDFLKRIKMPHFWMSYFQVSSTEESVEIAKEFDGKIEIGPTKFYNGEIALIRDPQGAGFTIYDGTDLYLGNERKHGTIIRTELHVSNIQNVIPFYSALFDWTLIKTTSSAYKMDSNGSDSNILIQNIDNTIKGRYEYWATTILVDDVRKCTQLIRENGGSLIVKERGRNLMTDNTLEAFFYIQEMTDDYQ